MSNDASIPEYIPGDVATVEFIIRHEANIDEIGAWFTRESEDEGDPEIFFLGTTEPFSRDGSQILSRVSAYQTITHQYLPGDYFLRAMTAFSEEGARHRRLDNPPEIRLRVLPEPKTRPEVTHWEIH